MKRRALLVAVALGLAGGRAPGAEESAVDAEFLEFLGSMEGEDESFDRYLVARERAPRTPSDEARVNPAEHDDADTR